MTEPVGLLTVRGVSKQFPGTLALDKVDFEVMPGEIHALVGENGAGKSTLIKILAGVYAADSGDIQVKGRPLAGVERAPISFIHQDLGLVGSMTVAENIALVTGYPRGVGGLIRWRQLRENAARVLASVGSTVDPDERAAGLSSADRSLVAIARALAIEADVVVLDEPTASLPEADVRQLFDSLRRLRARSMGIVFVTHRLDEVFRVADRVTVIRDGRNVVTTRVADTTPSDLVFNIVGRKLSELFITPPPPRQDILLELVELRAAPNVGPITLQLRAGEILGLVGLRGAGQDLVGRTLFGAVEQWSGTMTIAGQRVTPHQPAAAIEHGVAFVSSKRAEESLASNLTVRENVYPNPVRQGTSLFGLMSGSAERRRIAGALERFNIRPRDPERLVGTLSGGNQQKTVLARWLEASSRLLVLEEPTTGVDVGSKAEIYHLLAQEVGRGSGVLLVSSDFEEVAGISHRALVMRRGRVVAEVVRDQLTVERLTELASGAADSDVGGRAA
jgi:ribose transport system ATP-binding protein